MQKYSNCQKDFFKFEIVKAPLATFDTIDLGSDDESSTHVQHSSLSDRSFPSSTGSQSSNESIDSNNIKLNSATEQNNSKYSDSDSGTSTPTNEPIEIIKQNTIKKTNLNKKGSSQLNSIKRTRPTVVAEPAIVLKLDANISDKFKKKRSGSSSSDSDSDVFTFENIQTRHEKDPQANVDGENVKDKNIDTITLSPVLVDPSQIKSPSKRKAYEKRLQRLQVTTSPIARPRSTTPINVVTLDEYITSSPEFSPTTEKLKIVLPPDEFNYKPKSPRKCTKKDSESLDFTEELLFSRTKSALVVDQTGNLPISPKRVLIPPTISPNTSPKISTVSNVENPDSPKYVYFKSHKHCISPLASEPEQDWATFPKTSSPQNEDSASVGDTGTNYAREEMVCGADSQSEEILTVNIANNTNNGKCDIELTLSSSNSSNSMNPSPDSSSVVTSANLLNQDKTESELDFPMDTSEDDSSSFKNVNCTTPDSDQY